MTPTEALQTLHNALPANPDDHGPIAVPSDAVRALFAQRTPAGDEETAE